MAMNLISEVLDSSYFVHEPTLICPSPSFFNLKGGMLMFISQFKIHRQKCLRTTQHQIFIIIIIHKLANLCLITES